MKIYGIWLGNNASVCADYFIGPFFKNKENAIKEAKKQNDIAKKENPFWGSKIYSVRQIILK